MLFDAHTHLMNADKPYPKIVCATQKSEWMELLAIRNPGVIKSFGLHPWYSSEMESLHELEEIIADQSCLVGEIGLDYANPSASQKEAFITQLKMAQKHQRIVVIHCVKAWDDMCKILKSYNTLSFIFHRFNGSSDIIKQLPECSYFSLQGKNSRKYLDFLPSDRVLLESDDEDMDIGLAYSAANLNEKLIYNNAKRLLGGMLP